MVTVRSFARRVRHEEPPSKKADIEIEHLVSSLQSSGQGAFEQVKEILDFTLKARVFITETHVRQHIDYFKGLLDSLTEGIASGKEVPFEDLLNTL